jgi:hypothetical protein
LTSFGLIAATGGSFAFRIILFGWPLVAAAYFRLAVAPARSSRRFAGADAASKPDDLNPEPSP